MSQQLCTPKRIYGGEFSQTLLLGCSIMNITASIGWNEQQSEVDINLVQDPCSAPEDFPKVYYDKNLVRKTTTSPDPGFTYPAIGSPIYVRVEDWEFSGLLQSYEQTNDQGSNPTFRIKIVDPRTILEGAQVIMSDYAGKTFDTPNVFNAYGFAESFGNVCELKNILGAYFGSPAGAFGGALTNDNGIQWNVLKEAISVLTSALPTYTNTLGFSQYGRLAYVGNEVPGYGAMKADYYDINSTYYFPSLSPWVAFYLLDFSEIPAAPSYYRLTGTSMSLLDIISNVCQDAGCDYYIELIPIKVGNIILKVIKIRVAIRGTQPDLGAIEQFIDAAGNVISKSFGRELRNEVTSQFIIGGNVDSIYQADKTLLVEEGLLDDDQDIVIPYWGLDRDGNIIPTEYDTDDKLNFTVDLTQLNTLLYQPLGINEAKITEYELQAALTGQDAWIAIASGLPSDLGNELQIAGILDPKRILDTLNKIGFPHHLIVPGKKAGGGVINFDDFKNESNKLKDIETIYNFVLNYARDFYGKKFVVRVPYTCTKIDTESFSTETSESPGDSGWTEEGSVIGLDRSLLDVFSDDVGKIYPFVRYDDAATTVEISNVSEEDYITIDDNLYIKASLGEQTFVYESFFNRFNPHVVIELAAPILERLEESDVHRTKLFASKFFKVINGARAALGLGAAGPDPPMDDVLKNSGNSLLHLGITSRFRTPNAISVPIHSNVYTYGPWTAVGPIGLTRIEKDEGLVPWEYGSSSAMDLAGNQKVTQGVTNMQIGEMGSLTIPGYPQLSLGNELLSGGLDVFENRFIANSNPAKIGDIEKNIIFLTFNGVAWFGTFGPNITGITIDIGEQGLTTTYNLRTYTPKFGRFSKRNADRLKEYTAIINTVKKQARLASLAEFKIQTNRRNTESRIISNRFGNPFSVFASSPPGVLVGQIVNTPGGDKSTGVHLIKHNELVTELEKYEDKAFMSLDGLLRPISKSGSGGLPRFTNYNGGCNRSTPTRPEPPLTAYTPLTINQPALDPWANGHDIDILGRGTEVPDNLSVQLDTYTNDYRGLALKGPLLLQAWGYDTDGKPIPNEVDTEADMSGGTFKSYNLKDTFFTDYKKKPQTWPVAPIDLRLDRKRGVWVSPQPYRIVKCRMVDPLDVSGARATVIDGNSVENADGTVIDKDILVTAISSSQTAGVGDIILAEYDVNSCTYRAIEVPPSQSTSAQVIIGKTRAASRSQDGPYDTVTCVRMKDFISPQDPQVVDEVFLIKHHTSAVSSNNKSAYHQHDVRKDEIILYMPVTIDVSGESSGVYCAITDYSREHSLFFATAQQNSVGPDFTDFRCQFIGLDGYSNVVKVKNRLRQPILAGDCCYIYRHKSLPNSITDEFWLVQGQFGELCLVSDIAIGTGGFATIGEESDSIFGGNNPAITSNLVFQIKDKTIYLESAWKINRLQEGSTYLGEQINHDDYIVCNSSGKCGPDKYGNAGYQDVFTVAQYYIDFSPFYLQNQCLQQGNDWDHNNQGSCDVTDIEYDTNL